MKRRYLSFMLVVIMFVALLIQPQQHISAVSSVSKTDEEIIDAAMVYLNIKEGNCDSVNANDNGAVSIGMIQWHATRALNILKQIIALIPDYAKQVLGETFYNEILTATSWENRIVNAEEKAALVILLGTEESKQVQIAQARSDLGDYLAHAKRQGMGTPALQFYFMDIENQYGYGGVERMLSYAKETAGVTQFQYLYEFHNAMRFTTYQSVQNYIARRESTFSYVIKTLGWESTPPYLITADANGGEGSTPATVEVYADESFTFPENPYMRAGYTFKGWNLHRLPDDTWYIANIGWCTPGWIESQGYTKCLYQPGQTQAVDKKFMSSAPLGATYVLVPVWEPISNNLPISSNGCTHNWKPTKTVEASCAAGAYTDYTCTKCGMAEREETAMPNGHSYGNWTVLREATCESKGLRSTTCSVCGMTQTDMIDVIEHQPGEEKQLLAPGCTTEGHSVVTCTLCNEILQLQTIPATGHIVGEIITDKEATCTEAGREYCVCTVCSTVIYAATIPAQHAFADWIEFTPPTELGDGVRVRECSVCGQTQIQKIPGGTHAHAYKKSTVAPTCTTEGYDLYTCDCGETYKENISPALGHNTYDTVTKATCCSDGFRVCTCANCHETWLTVDQSALGHQWDNGTVTKAASAEMDGITTYTCTRCGAEKTQIVAATGTCAGADACPSHAFTDMLSGWAHAGLDFCVERGLLSGTSATTLAPNSKMSRAMLVAVLYSLEGKPAVNGNNLYTDVVTGSWYDNPVRWATGCGIVSGTGNNCFTPNGNVTREQIAAILYRYAIYKGYDFTPAAELSDYPDWAKISLFARAGMKWSVGSGIISGKLISGKTYLDPLGHASRAEVAAILMSFIKNVVQ